MNREILDVEGYHLDVGKKDDNRVYMVQSDAMDKGCGLFIELLTVYEYGIRYRGYPRCDSLLAWRGACEGCISGHGGMWRGWD